MNENKGDAVKGIGAVLLIIMIQALVVALIVSFFWIITLQSIFGFNITFFQWFGIIFCFNLIRIDIVKIVINQIIKTEENELRKGHTENHR